MAFDLLPGETVIWGATNVGDRDFGLSVTTHRVLQSYSRFGDSVQRWVSLESIDSASQGRFRRSFPWKTFWLLIPLILWFFGRDEAIVLTSAGNEAIRIESGIITGGLPRDFLDVVASARHSLVSRRNSLEPQMRVTLSP